MDLLVELPHHSYKLTIESGLLKRVGNWLLKIWSPRKIVIISDETVAAIYAKEVRYSLEQAGYEVYLYEVKPGEISKSLDVAAEIYDFLASNNMTRQDGIVALGGGVVGDLAGFVASTYMRGVPLVQIPTTLLAQVDSSIGGKTAVNTSKAKNLVGTFYQPDGVLIDTDTLKTLQERQIREGLAEVVKSAAIADKKLWSKLNSYEDEYEAIANADELIHACCDIKRAVVVEDEKDNGKRLILNFGHTIAHAIELVSGYGEITHGEAVAIGMVEISKAAEKNGDMSPNLSLEIEKLLKNFNLPTKLTTLQKEAIFEAMLHDKKAQGDSIKLILLEEIGQAKIKSMKLEEVKKYLSLEEL